ncbi:MAG TPA: fasciclin domain-containing protein [Pyrinomonadaceae bacterium]|nr:fasciclin domain-containing protein [Pyrinomonadaceae bacterium]
MKKIFAVAFAALVSLAAVGSTTSAQMMNGGMKSNNPMVGGAAMYRSKTIVENALNSPIHTTLVAAVKAAGLVDTLAGKGPFTVFAPTNDAFAKLPAGAVDTLVMPENKAKLTKILTYHVVAGRYDSKKIAQLIKKGNGTATFTTVSGDKLMARMDGNNLILVDEKGGTSTVTTADVYQSNGVIHVIDTVVTPS